MKINDVIKAFNGIHIVSNVIDRTNVLDPLIPKNCQLGKIIEYVTIYPVEKNGFKGQCDISYCEQLTDVFKHLISQPDINTLSFNTNKVLKENNVEVNTTTSTVLLEPNFIYKKYVGIIKLDTINAGKVINGVYEKGDIQLLAKLMNISVKKIYNIAYGSNISRNKELLDNKIKKYSKNENIAIRVLKEEYNFPWELIALLLNRNKNAISVNYYNFIKTRK